MTFGGSQVRPPSVVRVNIVSSCPTAPALEVSLPCEDRRQTAYATFGLLGSAVIDALSSRWPAFVSSIRLIGAPQVSPPSLDLLTRMALPRSDWVTMWFSTLLT